MVSAQAWSVLAILGKTTIQLMSGAILDSVVLRRVTNETACVH